MADQIRSSRQDVDFIRLFFPGSVEEEIAARWASRLALLIGPRIVELRPETTLAEMLEWAVTKSADTTDFVVVFEPELRMQLAFFLEDPDHATFREMVQYVGGQYGSVASDQKLSHSSSHNL